MRSVHLLGLGLLVGATALGATLSVVAFRWQTETLPGQGTTPTAQKAGAATASLAVDSTKGKATFDAKCAGCHTIGGGKLAGPDLEGVAEQRPHDWLVDFITAPDRLIAGGDPTAVQLAKEFGMPMPNVGVSRADAEAILSYVAAQSGGGGAAAAGAAASVLPPGNAATGRLLVAGEQRPANGGSACIGCHDVAGVGALGGGSMGLDLTHAHTRFGVAGLASILKSPPYPGMTEAFASHPITDQEVADVTAFLAQVDTTQEGPAPSYAFPLVGLGAFALFLGLMQVGQRGRSQGVRRRLVGRRGR